MRLLKKEKEMDELKKLKNEIYHLPKSMARELNIDKILD